MDPVDGSPLTWGDVDRTRLEQLLASGATPDEVAARCGRSGSLVRKAARQWGLDARALRARSKGLMAVHPALAAEFIEVVDGATRVSRPDELLPGSGVRCRWRCTACDHEWVTSVVNRARKGSGCPACARVRGVESARQRPARSPAIATARGDLAVEFISNLSRPDRDATTTPSGSHDRVRWRCVRGHAWTTTARQRVKYETQCPVCLTALRVSRLEHRVAAIVEEATGMVVTIDNEVVPGAGRQERIDLKIAAIGLLLDLDPSRWHRSEEANARDTRKATRLRRLDYWRIRPTTLPPVHHPDGTVARQHAVAIEDEADPVRWAEAVLDVVAKRAQAIPSQLPTSDRVVAAVRKADRQWYELRQLTRPRSLATEHPVTAAEFVEIVGVAGVSAEHVPPGSDDRAVWECGQCSHRWTARIANRTTLGTGCPLCSQRRGRATSARPDLGCSFADLHPGLVVHFRENLTSPGRPLDQLKPSSTEKCLWDCPHCGRPWVTTPHALTRNPRRGCSECKHERAARTRRSRSLNN